MTTVQRLPAWPSDLAETHRFQAASTAGVDTVPTAVGTLGAALNRIALGRFRVFADLGAGSMGEVALAEDSLLGRRVAIKRLRAALAGDPWHRWRLRNEARIAAQLDHPAIVRVLDLVCEDGVDHIVMEYVPGPSLRTLRGGGPLAIARTVQIAVELADALDHVHGAGIIHRDVKLENVLTSQDGRPKLNDFGIACTAMSAAAGGGDVMGTPRSMSPEQALGEPVDSRSDLFSLGVLLYELVTGASPFAGDDHAQTMRRIVLHQPRPLAVEAPGVPPALAELVDQLLDKSVPRRPQSAQEVAVRLRAIGDDARERDQRTMM
jgi:serine/threonine protein kinase